MFLITVWVLGGSEGNVYAYNEDTGTDGPICDDYWDMSGVIIRNKGRKEEKKTERWKDRKMERQKNGNDRNDRKTERQKDRKTERKKDRKTERKKDRKSTMLQILLNRPP
jgi:hypothetical protein